MHNDYPSIISGGHNFSKISFGRNEVFSQSNKIDILVALDKKTIKNHKNNLKKKNVILYDNSSTEYSKNNFFGIPASKFIKELDCPDIIRNTVFIGALSFISGIKFEFVRETLEEVYPSKKKLNIKAAKKGYDFAKENFDIIFDFKKVGKQKEFMNGNSAISEGTVKAGLETYIAYPMTPATSILHHLAAKKNEYDLNVVQPENEIAVITMAMGSSYAGSKTMIGTSGGGFALMTEAISFSGISEIPLLIVESQRTGPSTGVPTYTAQSDLSFVLNSGHGEFPKAVIAPGTHEECFYKSAEALRIAWKYQIPVILLIDKHLSESYKTLDLNKKIKKAKAKISKSKKNYMRYKFTKDGISPLDFPGMKNKKIKATSYEHDEFGITTENPEKVKKMIDKRFKKIETLKKEMKKLKTINVYGRGKNTIITWGSTTGAVVEAVKELKNVKVVQPIYMEPFPTKEIKKYLKNSEKIISIEANATGQLAKLVKMKTNLDIDKKILKYDSREFNPEKLRKDIKRCFK